MTSTERFERLSLPHVEAMHRLAIRLAGNEAEAEDLVQEALYRACRSFGTFELREYGAKPWLLKILHNVFFTRRGRESKQPMLLDEIDLDHFAGESGNGAEHGSGDVGFDWEQVDQEVMWAVQALPAEYRSVLMLWASEGLSYKEIAEVCDCAVGTVMSRLFRARQTLHKKLTDYAQERNLPNRESVRHELP